MTKRTAKISILSLLLVVATLSAAPLVSAEEPTPRLPKMGPFLGPSNTDPFVAGYLDIPSTTTKKVKITVSFPNTSPSVIPTDNYIAGGMFLQSQDSEVQNTDYGWVTSLSLDHEGKLQYNMGFYETYEGSIWPPEEWIDQYYKIVWKSCIVLTDVDPSTPVTLTMGWSGSNVEWLYTIDGITHLAGDFNAWEYRASMHDNFRIGTIYEWFKWIYYYQFGIYSETEILNSGWTVRLEHPQYYTSYNQWELIFKAKFVQGTDSYMDNWWRWGGWSYDNVGARYYGHDGNPGTLPRFEVEFYYDPNAYLKTGWVIWDMHEPGIPSSLEWLTLWMNPMESLYWDNVIAQYLYEAGVEIQIQPVDMSDLHGEIATRYWANIDTDIISMPAMWLPEFANWKIPILAIPPAYVQNNVKAPSAYPPAAVEAATYKSIVYGYPSQYDSWALVYNRQLFQNEIDARTGDEKTFLTNTLAKLEADTPLSWEELKRAARLLAHWSGSSITQTGFCPMGVGMPKEQRYQFLSLLWSNGGEYLDLSVPETRFDKLLPGQTKSSGVEVMELYHDLGFVAPRAYDPGFLPDYEWGAWQDETVAMMLLPSGMPYIRDAMEDRFSHLGVAPIPIGPSGTESVSAKGNWMLTVSQKAKDEGRADAAWGFLTWLNTPMPAQSIPMPSEIGAVPKGNNCSIMGDFLIFDNALPSKTDDQKYGMTTIGYNEGNGRPGTLLKDDFWFKGFMDIGTQYGRVDKAFLKSEQAQYEIGLMFERVILGGADPTTAINEAATAVQALLPMAGDINLDGIVAITDAVILITDWGATPTSVKWNRGRSDIKEDSAINILDGIILSVNYGRTGDPPVGESNESLSPVYASSTALSVEPSVIVSPEYGAGTWFTVNVTVTDVTDLFGYEFKLKYNATLLTANSITLGNVFPQQTGIPPDGPTIIWKKTINDTLGYAWYAVSLGDYADTYPYGIDVYGTETLATINFTVTGSGESILDLVDTVLCDSEGNAIAYEVHIGLFSNVADLAQPIADLADWKAMPEQKHFDQSKELEKGEDLINALYAEVQNLGDTTVRVKVRFTISDGYGVPVAAFETSPYTFVYGTYLSIHIFDTSTDVTPPEFDTSTWGTGTFYVEAQCLYYDYVLKAWVGGNIKTFSFTVVP